MEDLYPWAFSKIKERSGLTVNDSHKKTIRRYIGQRMEKLGLDEERFRILLDNDRTEFELLINEAAINETYFFREEPHFDYLNDIYFPKKAFKELNIWSASCSSGEEVLSILALSQKFGIKTKIYASDIDTAALEKFKAGEYTRNSLRRDGKKYHDFLKSIGKIDQNVLKIYREIYGNIFIFSYNLNGGTEIPIEKNSLDLIFLRNTFIYFNQENRTKILKKIEGLLKPDGLLFFSMNEIAGIEEAQDINLVKENYQGTYFFRKSSSKAPSIQQKKQASSITIQVKPIAAKEEPRKISLTEITSKELKEEKESFADVKKAFFNISSFIDRQDLDGAEKYLSSLSFKASDLSYRFYFEGLIYRFRHQKEKAIQSFLKSSLANPDLWPALFQLGLLYKDTKKTADMERTFEKCAKILEQHIKEEKACYNFLVESFSPSYFYNLCKSYIKKD